MSQEINYDNLLAYGTYTVLYLNDTAVNCCLMIEKQLNEQGYGNYICNLYRKLKKQVQAYNKMLYSTMKDDVNQFAEFNGNMDDLVDEPLYAYRRSIAKVYEDSGVPNADFYALLETARSLTEYACSINDYIIQKIQVHNKAIANLSRYRLTDVNNACNKFVRHVYSLLKPQPAIVMNTESEVVEKFRILNDALLSLNSFDTAYRKTVEELNKTNTK